LEKDLPFFLWTILTSKRKATNNRVVLPLEEKKKLVDLTFPVATLILKGTNITERRYNYNHKTKGKIVRLTSILFSSSEICSLILASLPFFVN